LEYPYQCPHGVNIEGKGASALPGKLLTAEGIKGEEETTGINTLVRKLLRFAG